jgi:hypothetical protein
MDDAIQRMMLLNDAIHWSMCNRDMKVDIDYLETNDLGLKISDKGVVVGHIRPLRTFDMWCPFEHRMAGHIFNRRLVKVEDVYELDRQWDYNKWCVSTEGVMLTALDSEWRGGARCVNSQDVCVNEIA